MRSFLSILFNQTPEASEERKKFVAVWENRFLEQVKLCSEKIPGNSKYCQRQVKKAKVIVKEAPRPPQVFFLFFFNSTCIHDKSTSFILLIAELGHHQNKI